MTMKRIIQLPILQKERSTTEITVTVSVNQESLASWCMELVLLEKGLTEFLTITDQSYSTRLELLVDPKIHQSTRGKFTKSAKGISLSVTPTELELWSSFFLKYYCNEVADVDHLDLEVRSEASDELFLVLKAENFLTPMSETEVRHRLNL